MFRIAASVVLTVSLSAAAFSQGWQCYGGNAQHTGIFEGTSQTAALIQWQAPLDDGSSYYGGATLTHYAAPMVTPLNTVVYGYRYTTTVGGNPYNDNWSVIGRNGVTGAQEWQLNTDYSAALLMPNDWTTVFPVTLYKIGNSTARGVVAAGSGGSVLLRKSADSATDPTTRLVFYTTVADFNKNISAYAPIKINTPLSADNVGNIYFGYEVIAPIPSNISALGTGGIAKVNLQTGASTYKSVEEMNIDPSLVRPSMNAAPAITTDGTTIYVGLTNANGSNAWLAKLSTKTLAVTASAQIYDPSIPGADAALINESSASPMIGPDGHVFMGVFGNQYRESHGWMVQYDANLKIANSKGQRWPTGAFGWDDTSVVVPTSMVPSYKGKATYLILTKYNNYDFGGTDGGDGSNKVAVLDPTSDSISRDRQSGIPVMNEILTLLGPNLTNDDPSHPNARYEWCINSAAIDVNRKCAIVNSEDGHMYRWSFVSNSITEALDLEPPTGEAYTETGIGPDGQLYVINNATLFAIGSTKATSVSLFQGVDAKGNLADILYSDGLLYSGVSVSTSAGESVGIEADFTLANKEPSTLNVSVDVKAESGISGTILAYNNTTKVFDTIASGTFTASLAYYTATVTTNAADYIGPKGKVRIRVQGLLPHGTSKSKFTLAADLITCNAK